jgi:hypothetical protein
MLNNLGDILDDVRKILDVLPDMLNDPADSIRR